MQITQTTMDTAIIKVLEAKLHNAVDDSVRLEAINTVALNEVTRLNALVSSLQTEVTELELELSKQQQDIVAQIKKNKK